MYDRRTRGYLARCLADAFLAGVWSESALAQRAGSCLDHRPRWLRGLARQVLTAYPRPPSDRSRELGRFIELALDQRRPGPADAEPPQVRRWLVPQLAMGRRRWPVPELSSTAELAEFLDLDGGELAWLADTRSLERVVADERLRNYRYLVLPRRGGPSRVIESPKARLKALQRRLLHEILDWIPAHDAAHGFTPGRSALSHAGRHTGRRAIVRLDLEDFFASIAAARVYGIFRTAGYPEPVAHTLTGLSTNVMAAGAWAQVSAPADQQRIAAHHRLGRRLSTPHLPQGAPTSPALANLAAFGLDRRLRGLAQAHELTYSRYADDLTFSGPTRLLREADRLRVRIAAIAAQEGFPVNHRKSALVTQAGRQQVCGIVVNRHLNVPRTEYDMLKATLHNLGRDGPGADPRGAVPGYRAHLVGRIAWVASLNPARGARLRAQLAQVRWEESPEDGEG